ncbi:hypothetical protein WK39_03060 [Burkholderia cepacia]|uniref:hypothetical protein n=1 Tax=Burkholderia cepacia TaxID=292 RepID=UPI00075F2F35|nr:hypothetical protein [Burkholderia cepacia]KVS53271.1 hypothetical protein WK39_03060 [Burkholderia cepacia]KVS57735.1 hypothetical protein WK40_25510 [Burkholderia cepacia]CAG9268969.1 conserved hypothetical protein [Burkholderia cepacia]
MANTNHEFEALVRRGIDGVSCSREGFRRMSNLLAAIARFAEANGDAYTAAVAIVGADVAETYLDLAETAHKELIAKVSHG